MNTYIDLLGRNHNYRNLWLAKMVSYLGDWFNLLASATLIASLTGSGAAISYLFLARFLPLFFASPVAGVVADRYSRRMIMIVSDVLRALTVLGFLLIRSDELIWLFYLLTVIQFTLSAFFTPAQSALLPKVVDEDDLVAANALDGFTWSSMLAIGAMLGGLATAYLGITAAFVIDAFTFLLSAWFVSRIDLPRTTAHERLAQANQGSGFFEFVGGLRYLAGRPFILGLALVKAGGALIWGAINVVEIPLAETVFPLNGNGTLTLGIIYAATGIGTALGPILLRQWMGDSREASLRAITLGFVMLTLGVTGLGLANMLPMVRGHDRRARHRQRRGLGLLQRAAAETRQRRVPWPRLRLRVRRPHADPVVLGALGRVRHGFPGAGRSAGAAEHGRGRRGHHVGLGGLSSEEYIGASRPESVALLYHGIYAVTAWLGRQRGLRHFDD